MTAEYYDDLTPFYKLMYPDWEKSMHRQANMLDSILREYGTGKTETVLDVACGIGTQCIGLAQLGYKLSASDLSPVEVERARAEAFSHGVAIDFRVGDMKEATSIFQEQFDAVIACDNAIPHLLTNSEILQAFRQFHQCLKSGGICLISVRDYAKLEKHPAQPVINPRLVHEFNEEKVILFDLWKFDGDIYEISTYIVQDKGNNGAQTQIIRGGKYYRVEIGTLCELFTQAGYLDVKVLDDRYFQPVIIARKP